MLDSPEGVLQRGAARESCQVVPNAGEEELEQGVSTQDWHTDASGHSPSAQIILKLQSTASGTDGACAHAHLQTLEYMGLVACSAGIGGVL